MQTPLYLCVQNIIFHSLPITKPTVPVIRKLWIFVMVQEAIDVFYRLPKNNYDESKECVLKYWQAFVQNYCIQEELHHFLEGREKEKPKCSEKILNSFQGTKHLHNIFTSFSAQFLCCFYLWNCLFSKLVFSKVFFAFPAFSLNPGSISTITKNTLLKMVQKVIDLLLTVPCFVTLKCDEN